MAGWLSTTRRAVPGAVSDLVLFAPSGIGRRKLGPVLVAALLGTLGDRGRRRALALLLGPGTPAPADAVHQALGSLALLTFRHFRPRTDPVATFSDERLRSLPHGLTAMFGARDRMLDGRGAANRLRRLHPEGRVVLLPNRGHLVPDPMSYLHRIQGPPRPPPGADVRATPAPRRPSRHSKDQIMMTTDEKAVAIRSMHLMSAGSLEEFREAYTPDCHNREAKGEPPACRGQGPEAMYATALWLREAFSGLTWDIHDSVQEDDLVAVHATMRGQHTGTFVAYAPDASIAMAFPPRGRSFAITQSHWFRMKDGKVAEHWANRDDRSMGEQLGWTPPTPTYLARMLWSRRRARQGATA